MAARLTAYLVALIVGTTFIAGLIVGAQRDDDGPVDLIVRQRHASTPPTATGTMAEAVAVQGNKILRVGTTREVQRLRRAADRRGRCEGRRGPARLQRRTRALAERRPCRSTQLNLLDARDAAADRGRRSAAWAAAHPDRAWVTGRGWYYEPFTGGLPTRQMLDALVPDRPAYLDRRTTATPAGRTPRR